jgi:hypothetical protein
MYFLHEEILKELHNHIPGFADYEVIYEMPEGFWSVILKTHAGKEYVVSIPNENMAQGPLVEPDKFAIYVATKLYAAQPELAYEAKLKPPFPPGWSDLKAKPIEDLKKYEDLLKTKHYSDDGLVAFTPPPKPPPNFGFITSESAVVTLNDNLTQFASDMKPIFKHMGELAEKMGDAFADVAEAMKPLGEALTKATATTMAPGIALSQHEDMHKILANCPDKYCVTNHEDQPIYHIIQHLNDHHKWKRERIADWLDTLDKQPVFYPEVEDGEALYA